MDQEFIDLMNLLLLETKITSSNMAMLDPDYLDSIKKHVDSLNRILKLKKEYSFLSNFSCSPNTCSSPLAPVVFSSSYIADNHLYKFAVFGLNPLANNSICYEKGLAGNILDDYAAFYNSKSCTGAGVFPFVLDNPIGSPSMSGYYRKIFDIFYSLINGNYETWKSVFPSSLNSKEIADKYIRIIKENPIIVAELIPFHSKKTKTFNIDDLYGSGLKYEEYHKKLFEVLDKKLAPNGILFSHGKAASKALKKILENNGLVIIKETEKYKIGRWGKRPVIIFNYFLRSVGGLNSDKEHDSFIKDFISCEILGYSPEGTDSNKIMPVSVVPIQFAKIPIQNGVGGTNTIWTFTGSSKGLNHGDLVEFPANHHRKKPYTKIITGNIVRIFNHNKNKLKEEANIKGIDGETYFRREEEITKI